LRRRRELSDDVRAALALRLAREGLRLAAEARAVGVSAFHPMPGEPDTLPLLQALAGAGFVTSLPVTLAFGQPLTFRSWRPGEPLSPGFKGILEPPVEAPEIAPDLLFVPLAAFDRRGGRVGYGAGLYDRTLAGLRSRKAIRAVGVAFSASEVESVPSGPFDEPLDLIVTESETIFPRGIP